MGRLGEVLEALYEAPRHVQALHVRARLVADESATMRVFEWWRREQQERDGSSMSLLITSSAGDATDEDEDGTRYELWRAGVDRWRADTGDLVTILEGADRLTYSPAMGGYRLPAGQRADPPWAGLLRPRWIPDRSEIEIRGTDTVAGRLCWWLELQPTADPMPGLHNPFIMKPWLGTQLSCRVDQQTGIVLAVEGRFEGEVCSTWTTGAFDLVDSIDPAVFAFVPPDGKGFRGQLEMRAESMRRAGLDLTGIDLTDEAQLNEAMMRYHRQQFSVDPASLAEQHVPTGPPPEDIDGAEAEVRGAFERIVTPSDDGEAVPAVEGGANLGPCLREAGSRAPGGPDLPATVKVEYVKFLAPDAAVAWFTLLRGGNPVLGTIEGRARRFGTRWLVSRATFCKIVASVGVRCPPAAGNLSATRFWAGSQVAPTLGGGTLA